jgi:cytochrome d ubiquinol oxidase subunit I
MEPLFWHRLQFGFTVTYHYLFPQLTMGLALLLVVFKWMGLRGDREAAQAARFWTRIFGLNFAVGVVTGIPLEFQFGTNWGRFSHLAGGVIGQTLAMEGLFAFFLESTFLGLVLFGEERLGPRKHFAATVALFLGSWLSGWFIIVTNAFMQHPVGHRVAADGTLQLDSFWTFLLNPWAVWQYLHNMCGAVITGAFFVAGIGAGWTLLGRHEAQARLALRVGVITGLIASVLQLFPTGDRQGKLLAEHQPAALAAMEGAFSTGPRAGLAIIGQPDLEKRRLENPIEVPAVLSFLAYGTFGAEVQGLNDFPRDKWPDNIELLYYSYHVMVGLGTLFLLLMALSALQLWRRKLHTTRPLLWALLLAIPFPYIANTAGWMTAELGRQPWLVYGLIRTADGGSPTVSAGNTAFTALGFSGLYLVLGLVFLYLVGREIAHGPDAATAGGH